MIGDTAEVLDVAKVDGWKLVVAIAHSGCCTDVPSELLDYLGNRVWNIQDGYGEPGYTPCQGWDWSGIRDSSQAAKERMIKAVRYTLLRSGITQVTIRPFREVFPNIFNGQLTIVRLDGGSDA